MEQALPVKHQLEKSLELVKVEKEEDFNQHKTFIQSLSLDERVKQGYSWYPVMVTKVGYTYGERAFVILERNAERTEPHQFRSGKIANLFTNDTSVKNPERSGVVHFVEKNKMKIILNARDLPDWINLGMIGVDIMFDERTYLEMERALKTVMAARNNRLSELREVLLGEDRPRFSTQHSAAQLPALNESQNEAVNLISTAEDVAVIHGPPGTGKTTTLVEAVQLLVATESCVLVAAPSNTAVDLLTERLAEAGLQVARIGNLSRVDENLIRHTLEMQLLAHPESKNIKKMKKEAAEMRRKAGRYKRRFGQEERRERSNLYREAGELMGYANRLEQTLIESILDQAQVITCTLVGSANEVLGKRTFRTVVIDEAAQALEPATWIPIIRASRVVLTGDPCQLPPTVKSKEAERQGLNISLIERYLARQKVACLLRTQYRMHETIMGFSNRIFYENALQADGAVRDHRIPGEHNDPLVYIDTAGCGFQEKVEEKYQSRYNEEEALIIREHLLQLLAEQAQLPDEPMPSVAIISPYRQQTIFIKQMLAEGNEFTDLPISVNTIDGFQGQERDIVCISLVRSNDKGEIGFLKDTRRMNVAMTRARKQLIVIGDSATIGSDPFYFAFLEYCEQEGVYRTAWEYMK